MDCPACDQELEHQPVPRWKAPLLFVGVLLFCPCHLPATFAVLAAVGAGLGGSAWLLGNQLLVYVIFSLVYLGLLGVFLRWVFAQRDRERHREEIHGRHASDG